MGKAIGLDAVATGERLLDSDAKGWVVLPRARILLSTLPFMPDGLPFPPALPWDEGWRPRVFGCSPEPMMRAQGQRINNDGTLLPMGP
eukprot:11200584-Lingulodinium_polyedra.AAC.1